MPLQRIREFLALILIALLPFHAFLVTVLTKMIAGPGHAPLGWLVIWKEALLCFIVLLCLFDKKFWKNLREWDAVDACILGLTLIAVAIGLRQHALTQAPFFYGFRYDLLPPLSFLILRRVPWSGDFMKRAFDVLLFAGAVVAIAGLVMLVLPASALQTLGYSDLHSLYVSSGPLAPFQQLGASSIRRMQSVMSGPNQLGLWLLLPFAIALLRRRWILTVLFLLGVALTFSRAAWIAAALIALVVAWKAVRPSQRIILFSAAGGILIVLLFAGLVFAPSILQRGVSNSDHIARPLEAMKMIIAHPFGSGLGSAGPATNHGRATCVDLPAGSDISWAKDHSDLCVFVAGAQAQPRLPCNCPFLPENWYLQIGVELGVIGMLLYIALVILLLRHIKHGPLLLAFAGVCLAGLFLHSFEDFGVAATLWVLTAAVHSPSPRRAS